MASPRPPPGSIHVFLASPGDLAVERRAFNSVIDELNGGFGDGAGIRFVALGWERTLAKIGRRAQDVINQDIDRSDVFVLALDRRWGQEAHDAKPYGSYTEEEFHRALDRWRKTGSPEIFVFFKHVDPASMADPGLQLEKVLAFRKSLEDSRQVLYRFFADEKAFTTEVDRHLRAYAKGELPKADAPREAVLLPLEYIQEVTKAKTEAQAAEERAGSHQKHAEAQAARADKLALELAEQAATAAGEGRVEQARQTFAKAHEGTTNPRVLVLAHEFYRRTKDLKAAEDMLERYSPPVQPRDSSGPAREPAPRASPSPPFLGPRQLFWLMVLCLAGAGASLALVAHSAALILAGPRDVRIVSGSPALTFHSVSQGLATAIEDEFSVTVTPTNGAEQNLRDLCENGADIGLTHATLVPPCAGITAIANIFRSTLHIVARGDSGLQRLADFKPTTTVSLGPPGSGTAVLSAVLLKHYDVSYQKVEVTSFWDAFGKLERGDVQVMFQGGGIPIPWLMELRDKQAYRLLPVDRQEAIRKLHPYFRAENIDLGTYGGTPPFPLDTVKTIAVPAVLVVSPRFGQAFGAERAVERITELLFDRRNDLLMQHAALMYTDKQFATTDVGYALHAGARRYHARESTTFGLRPEGARLAASAAALLLLSLLAGLTVLAWLRARWRATYIALVLVLMVEITPQTPRERLLEIENALYALKDDLVRPAADGGMGVGSMDPAYAVVTDAIRRAKWFLARGRAEPSERTLVDSPDE